MPPIRVSILAAAVILSGAAFAQPASRPTDPQIAHIAYTAGQIDIQARSSRLKQSKNKEVRAFADDMVRDHKAVNEKALALVKKLNVKPEDNEHQPARYSRPRPSGKSSARSKGAAFDKAYAQNEVAYHQQVNSALQGTLIPNASNGELKDLLARPA